MRLRPEVIPDARRRRRAGGRVVPWLWFAGVPLLLSAQIADAAADDAKGNAPAGSYRAAQDAALDLQVDFDALHYESSDPMADNPPEGLTPGWDRRPIASTGRGAPESPGNSIRSCSIAVRPGNRSDRMTI